MTTSLDISEFVDLQDGTRVILRDDLGLTTGMRGYEADDDLRESRSSLIESVLTVVLPDEGDDDDGEDHPWQYLARLARSQGVDVNADDLRVLPYRVELTPAVEQLTRPG
ncbi:hypothetical protein [Aeromicrobium sp. P5_D10]